MGAVAAGAGGVQHRAFEGHRQFGGMGAHGPGAAGDLGRGFAVHAQRHQVAADLGGRGLAGHDDPHRGLGLGLGQMLVVDQFGDEGLQIVHDGL